MPFDAEPAAETSSTPVSEGARARLGMARRLAEIGLRIAERLDRQAEIAAGRIEIELLPDDCRQIAARRLHETADAFAKVSRAVSLALALEERIEQGWNGDTHQRCVSPLSPIEPRHPETPSGRPGSRLGERSRQVEQGVGQIIESVCEPPRFADLYKSLDRLLTRELAQVDALLNRPVEETIARIARELGLPVDPEQWEAAEAQALPPMPPPLGEATVGAAAVAASPPRPVSPACSPQRGEIESPAPTPPKPSSWRGLSQIKRAAHANAPRPPPLGATKLQPPSP